MATADCAEKILETSLQTFRECQPPERFAKFLETDLDMVKRQILAIQASQERLKSMIGWSRMESFITAFHQFQLMLGLSSDQISCIWGPILYTLQTAKEDATALDDVVQAYYSLGSEIPTMESYKNLLREKPAVKRCLAHMYQEFLGFQEVLLRFLSGHAWKATFHSNWRDYDQPFQNVLKSFKARRRYLENMLNSYNQQSADAMAQRANNYYQQYQDDRDNIENHIAQYEKDRETLLHSAKEQEEDRKRKQLEAVRNWLAAPLGLQERLHRNFADTRAEYPGTTEWILKVVEIQNWVCEPTPVQSILWINGKKGAGKSTLVSQIIDHCRESQENFKTSYFYCRQNNSHQDDCLTIYKTLLRQMLNHHPGLLPTCDDKRRRGNDILSDDHVAKILIERFCDVDMSQFIIIDGLDEIDLKERKSLVQFLSHIVDKCDMRSPGRIRVLLVSHDLADIRKIQRMDTATVLDLKPDDTQKAIKTFIEMNTGRLCELGLGDEEIEWAQKLIMARSKGMFLYASLVMENLLKQPTVRYAKEQLHAEVFPKDLKEAYGAIIRRLNRDLGENQWEMAKKIFGWLACAKRPLSWHEIQAALSIVPGRKPRATTIDYHHNQLRNDVREICGSLVHKLNNRIMFTHDTAREDLAEDERKSYAKEGYFSFQDYAIAKWGHHLEALIRTDAGLSTESSQQAGWTAQVSEALANFVEKHKEELEPVGDEGSVSTMDDSVSATEDSGSTVDIPASAIGHCRKFLDCDFYHDLVLLWTHVHKHQYTNNQRNKVSFETLEEALKLNRTVLEEMASPPGTLSKGLQDLYGDSVFKCDRVMCDFFYEGFKSKEARDAHIKRHERPFQCPVANCGVVVFGFSTNKDREKHVKLYHPDEATASGFIQMPREMLVEDLKHKCNVCGKSFTRKANRDAHVRSHYGDRPFACSSCDRAFVRKNDLKRHERDIHVRRRAHRR